MKRGFITDFGATDGPVRVMNPRAVYQEEQQLSGDSNTPKKSARSARAWRCVRCLAFICLLPCAAAGQQAEEDDDFIDPTRPTVSESATVQRPGVLQVEYGADANFRADDYHSQTSAPLGLRFAVNSRLRLDLDLDTFTSQLDDDGQRITSVGDTQLGFKAILRDKPKERLAFAFNYTVKLPSASVEKNLGSGRIDHNLRLIVNRTLGKIDLVFNASYLNVGRDDSDRRASGAQAIFAVTRELPRDFGVIGEVYGQSVDDPAGARGIYALGAVTYKLNPRLRFDAGARAGFGSDAPRAGVFAGLTIGVADLYRRR